MKTAASWLFVLLPCVPGLTLLLAGVVLRIVGPGKSETERVQSLFTAGGAVLLAGLVMGAFVAWRITHPRPDPDEEDPPLSGQ